MKPDLVLFPDASVKRYGNKVFYAGYGVIVLDCHTQKYTVLNGDLSSNSVMFGEIWAVYRGIQYVEHIRRSDQDLKILVVSDSKITVMALSTWIPKVWNLSDYQNWKKKDQTPVANQDLYRKILNVISNGHYKVKFVHINSHSKEKGTQDKIKKKMQDAGVKINAKTLDVFIQMNDLADKAANEAADQQKEKSGLNRIKRRDLE